jgi:hypothetical protein
MDSHCSLCRFYHLRRITMGKFLPSPKLRGEKRHNALWLLHSDNCGYWVIYPTAVSDRGRNRYSDLCGVPSYS